MIRRSPFPALLGLAALAFLFQPRPASAQRYVEHLIDSTFTNAAALDSRAGDLDAVPLTWEAALLRSRAWYQGGTSANDKDGKSAAAPAPFWKTAILSVSYNYRRVNSSSGGLHITEDTHGTTPALYLESNAGLSLDLSYSYNHTFLDSDFGESGDADDHHVRLELGQDLLRLLSLKSRDTLTLALAFSYGHFDSDSEIDIGRRHLTASSSEDIYNLAPNLIYVHPFTNRLSGSLAAAFDFQFVNHERAGDYNDGFFDLQGRLDYRVTKNLTGQVHAGWERHVAMGNGNDYDSGFFGAGLRYAICRHCGVSAEYEYQAFLPHSDVHYVTARLDFPF